MTNVESTAEPAPPSGRTVVAIGEGPRPTVRIDDSPISRGVAAVDEPRRVIGGSPSGVPGRGVRTGSVIITGNPLPNWAFPRRVAH